MVIVEHINSVLKKYFKRVSSKQSVGILDLLKGSSSYYINLLIVSTQKKLKLCQLCAETNKENISKSS